MFPLPVRFRSTKVSVVNGSSSPEKDGKWSVTEPTAIVAESKLDRFILSYVLAGNNEGTPQFVVIL